MFNHPQLPDDWLDLLYQEISKTHLESIFSILAQDIEQGITVFPAFSSVFRAFELTPLSDVKVVILGQDPYHSTETIDGEIYSHADGLAFSISKNLHKIPPSLKNIHKELKSDLGLNIPNHGSLDNWSKQGVLLLNSTLTVQAHKPNSHAKIGWQSFTDAVIHQLSAKCNNIVFVLWGNYAKAKIPLINQQKHLIITSPHPSPFSANRGFFGSKPFSKANNFLIQKNLKPINWQI